MTSNKLHSLLSLPEIQAATSVRVGKLWIPAKNVEQTLARFSHALVHVNQEIESYPYAFRGSSASVNFLNRSLLFCCKHQLADIDFRDVSITPRYDFGKNFITGGQYIFIDQIRKFQIEEFEDICCFSYNTDQYGISNFDKEFFEANEAEFWPNNTTNIFITLGFPTAEKEFRMDENEGNLKHIHFRQYVVFARYDSALTSSARHFRSARLTRACSFDFDGMSGAPVFHIGEDQNGFFIGLAGIIVRGGTEVFHFIEAAMMYKFAKEG